MFFVFCDLKNLSEKDLSGKYSPDKSTVLENGWTEYEINFNVSQQQL